MERKGNNMDNENRVITDDEICYHIIKHYGNKTQKEVMDKLSGVTWDRNNIGKEAYKVINNMLTDYMIKVANELYTIHKDDENAPWFIEEAFDNEDVK